MRWPVRRLALHHLAILTRPGRNSIRTRSADRCAIGLIRNVVSRNVGLHRDAQRAAWRGKIDAGRYPDVGFYRPAVHVHADDFYDRYIKSGYLLPWLVEAQAQNATIAKALSATAFAYADGATGRLSTASSILGPWWPTAKSRGRERFRSTMSC